MFNKLLVAMKQFGFYRTPEENWIAVSKTPQDYKDESPDGLYTSMIVPEHYLGERCFIIREKHLEYMIERLQEEYDKPINDTEETVKK